ncbi:MAG: glycosyltransferase [Chloroflexi bacterium]|nr:glycosyltransferase [Chloroflexota bacterium]
MSEIFFMGVIGIYLFVAGLLFVYGTNFFYMALIAWRHRHTRVLAPPLTRVPRVTVQLPIYNELYVAERLIDAVARLDYPSDAFEIQVLDDSTDETVEIARRAVERQRARGIAIEHVRRNQRVGFKAGALAHGLASATGEFIAIFDADFVPPPNFLKRVMPHFENARLAFVQTRWTHLNADYSLLTFLQSLMIDAHFMIEQFARWRAGYWFNFSGTAGVWRRAALEDAGGWSADTLAEDLDASYRAFLRGWDALYLRDVETPAEIPVSFCAYRNQQHRWARGSLECAIKLLPRVWRAPIPLGKKLQATLHLTGYGIHLLMFGLTLLYPILVTLPQNDALMRTLFGVAFIFNITTFAPLIVSALAQKHLGRDVARVLPAILFLTILGAGMMLNTVRAALTILIQKENVFERTPKFGIARRHETWTHREYQLDLDPIVYAELGLAFFTTMSALWALDANSWVIAFYSFLFSAGLVFSSATTIAQTIAVMRQRARVAFLERRVIV